MPPPDARKFRLAYIDWMRGLACLLMFQTHCYDSWLSPQARQSRFFMYSQLGGTFPAPLFLFLAGISFALVTEKLRQKNLPPAQIARTTIRRGAEIFGFGLLFRLQEYLVAWGWAPKSDLLRVDILNTIGLSMMLMGIVCWLVLAVRRGPRTRLALVLTAGGTALLISLLTPLLWTTWHPRWLPWPLESYVNGVHNLGTPQAGLFPVFPWTAFAFAGLAVGFILQSSWAHALEPRAFFSLGLGGSVLIEFARWLDAQPRQLYSVYDYWHTSPSFFLDPRGNVAGDSDRELRLVPLGRRPVGIQPTHATRPGILARLLGTHRIRLRPRLDPAEARDGNRGRVRGPAADLSCDAGAGLRSHEDERPRSGNAVVAPSHSSPRQLKGFPCEQTLKNLSLPAAQTPPPRAPPTAHRPPDRHCVRPETRSARHRPSSRS